MPGNDRAAAAAGGVGPKNLCAAKHFGAAAGLNPPESCENPNPGEFLIDA
jgi:hypothetical protein